ncbi:polysaccharide deacetylase family protein [Fictibacillus sp. Mic-4]|uniref:polysaccharide deacetylase family protein n=1 Tax=Fictibacillus sp. Mic-4 TaxID=3132826 RepID=UPI003CEFD944
MFKKAAGWIALFFVCLLMKGNLAMAATYTVQQGDTLKKISDHYGTPIDQLVNANQLQSTILNRGQQLKIPDTYNVKAGDTFRKISEKLGVSKSELIQANPQVKDPHWINPGQKLNVPSKNIAGMVYMGDSSKKRIALTFDDGPDDRYTPQILDILKKKHVKATFFVIGKQAKDYPNVLERIYKEGHAIGNHTWDHPHLPDLTNQQFTKEVASTSEQIEKVIGFKTNLFRPPFGEIKDGQLAWLKSHGYHSINWTIDTVDWNGAPAKKIVSTVTRSATPGAIVLQHSYHAEGDFETVKALPQIIDQLRAKGYTFVTVPTLLGQDVQKVYNAGKKKSPDSHSPNALLIGVPGALVILLAARALWWLRRKKTSRTRELD